MNNSSAFVPSVSLPSSTSTFSAKNVNLRQTGFIGVASFSLAQKTRKSTLVMMADEAFPAPPAQRQSNKREITIQMSELVVGNEYEGTVTGVVPYGCFVSIGAPNDGLLHVSQLSNSFVRNVEDIVKVGDVIKVELIAFDQNKNELSFKKVLTEEEKNAPVPQRTGRGGAGGQRQGMATANKEDIEKWIEENEIDKEEFYPGTVKSIMDFGAFVDIGAPTDGLVHISQLDEARVEKVTDKVKIGDEVQVRILDIDVDRGRISLSMRPLRTSAKRRDDDDEGDWEEEEYGYYEDSPVDPYASGDDSDDDVSSAARTKMDEELEELYKNEPKFKSDFAIAYEMALEKTAKKRGVSVEEVTPKY